LFNKRFSFVRIEISIRVLTASEVPMLKKKHYWVATLQQSKKLPKIAKNVKIDQPVSIFFNIRFPAQQELTNERR